MANTIELDITVSRIDVEMTMQGVAGPAGPDGADGPAGPAGQGVAAGGTAGQLLVKNSATNYDTAWQDDLSIAYAVAL